MHLLDYLNPEGPPTALFEIAPPNCEEAGHSCGHEPGLFFSGTWPRFWCLHCHAWSRLGATASAPDRSETPDA